MSAYRKGPLRPLRKRLATAQGGVCPICEGGGLTAKNGTLDHIIPQSRGGTGALANLRLAHKKCNSRRGNQYNSDILHTVTAKTGETVRIRCPKCGDEYSGKVPGLPTTGIPCPTGQHRAALVDLALGPQGVWLNDPQNDDRCNARAYELLDDNGNAIFVAICWHNWRGLSRKTEREAQEDARQERADYRASLR
jgi:hypothetical protein